MNDEVTAMSARELAALIREKRLSPVEAVEACLARIEAVNSTLRAFITVAAERALQAARHREAQVAQGAELGSLHGVPVALKDEAWATGMPATGGSLVFGKFVPSRNGTVTERLEGAGAVVIGKTNMPEFASWPRSKSYVAGESVNPWDLNRISGASSGGSAAAVAAGMVPVAIGSDGGGSIRIPSALCGVVGLFPTPGRVPCYGSYSYSPLGSLGPITRTVGDVALVQQVIAGPDPRDGAALNAPPPEVVGALDAGVQGLRLGWSPDFGRIPVDERIVAAARDLVELASTAGARVDEFDVRIEHPWGDGSFFARRQWTLGEKPDGAADIDIPDISGEQEWMWNVFASGVPLTATPQFRALCQKYHALLTPPSQLQYDPSAEQAPEDAVLPDEADLKRVVTELFSRYDVLCSPTMATLAPRAEPGWNTPYPDPFMGTNYTFMANSARCPAASIPCGLVDGLPVGLQIIGRPGDEVTVLQVSQALQAVAPQIGSPPSRVDSHRDATLRSGTACG